MYLSFLFNSMINHGYAPATFLQSNMVPIPKGAKANVTDSNMHWRIEQWRSKGGQGGGGHLPPGAARRGRQNPAKEFFKIYIRRNFKNSERIK